MIFEHFPYIARECSEIVHKGCFRDFLKNYKDCSNIFPRFFGDFFRDFKDFSMDPMEPGGGVKGPQ